MIRNSVLLTMTFAMFALAPLGRAQDQQPSLESIIEVFRADMRADRATIITSTMEFSDKDAATFWPIYRKYEEERTALDDRRVAVIKEYAQKYTMLSDSDAKRMAEQMLDCESRLAALKKKYFKELNKVLSPFTVAKFFQLEHRLDLLTDMKVESSLPALYRGQPTEEAK